MAPGFTGAAPFGGASKRKRRQVVRPTAGITEGNGVTAWPFEDPPNFTAFSTRQVLEGKQPIVVVYHDLEDGAWQFHGPGESVEADLVVICLEHAFVCDPSVGELADLPLGWGAWRSSPGSAWERFRVPPDA